MLVVYVVAVGVFQRALGVIRALLIAAMEGSGLR
jgi:hypothetical protein